MKNILKALTVLAAVATLASCDTKEEYVTYSYVILDLDSPSIKVNENDSTVTLGVIAYPKDGANVNTEITFEVINGTASNGTDFSVMPASGILSMTGTTDSITVNVVNNLGVITGDKSFRIRLTDASNGWTIGGVYETTITIVDLDVTGPMSMSDIAGNYVVEGTSYFNGTETWSATMYLDDSDSSKIWIDGIVPDFSGYYSSYGTSYCIPGTVSSDFSTITITTPVAMTGSLTTNYGDHVVFCIFDGDYYYSSGDFTLTYDSGEGAWISDTGFGLALSTTADLEGCEGYFVDLILPKITFTKN